MHSLIGRVPDLESGGSEFESRCADLICDDSLIGRVFGCDPKDMGSIPVHHNLIATLKLCFRVWPNGKAFDFDSGNGSSILPTLSYCHTCFQTYKKNAQSFP